MGTTEVDLRDGRARRRRHSSEFKAAVVAKCSIPGVSIAAVAMRHGLNANLLRRWVAQAAGAGNERMSPAIMVTATQGDAPAAGFVPVQLEAALPAAAVIDVELRRGGLTVKLRWPIGASRECGLWLRELLG